MLRGGAKYVNDSNNALGPAVDGSGSDQSDPDQSNPDQSDPEKPSVIAGPTRNPHEKSSPAPTTDSEKTNVTVERHAAKAAALLAFLPRSFASAGKTDSEATERSGGASNASVDVRGTTEQSSCTSAIPGSVPESTPEEPTSVIAGLTRNPHAESSPASATLLSHSGLVPESIPTATKQNNVIASEAKQSMRLTSSKDCFVADAPRNDGISLSTLTKIAKAENLTPGLTVALPLDISLTDASGAQTQPSGPVAVTVDIPRGMDASGAAAYHIADDGSFEKMPGSAGDGGRTYTFTTTHFSKYAIVTPTDTTLSAELLTAGDRGKTLDARTVYTIGVSTTITAGANRNGLVVNTTTSEADPAVLFIPGGMTLTVRGGAGTGTNGGKAAISLPSGGCLYVRGAGTLDVYGGSGASTAAWQGQSALRAGGEGWSLKASDGYDVWAGRGGVSSTGSGGGGAGVGTDGGAGGAAVGVSNTESVKGHYSLEKSYWLPDYLTEATGINGAAGGRGADTAEGGALYVLDAARVLGTGGAGGAIESSPAPAGRFIYENETGYPGGGGGGGGRGGSGALVGSGGAGGGGGGSGGSGGVSRHDDYPYYYPDSYGGGGGGGTGVPNGLNGAGTRAYLGGYGGAAGAAGVSGYGGAVTVAESASFSQTASYGPISGMTASLTPIDTGSNSRYWLTFEENRPDAASGVLSLPTPNPAEVTAGVTYPSPLAASLTGWRFTGFYTTTAAVGGARVIDDSGHFISNADGGVDGLYTTRNGSWCYPDDATLYAHWAPGVFTVALQAGAATTPGAAALYEKYDAGWYADASCAGPTIAAIATPERTGYFFEGYYTAPSGGGNPAIDADGEILSAFNEFPQGTTLYAYWTPVAELVEVAVNLDDGPYTGRIAALYQSGALRYTLKDDDNDGVYAYYQDDRGKPGYGVASGGYELYVDGAATGRAVHVLGATVDDVELDYYTATVTTELDGDPSRVAAVTLRNESRGAVPLVWDDSSNNFSAPLYLDPEGGGANVWEVYADGADTGFELNMNDEDMREATIPYYNATLDVTYETLWTGATVTLRQGGAVRHYLPYATNSAIGGGVVSTYQMAVRGDTGADAYDVFVNGLDTGGTLTLAYDAGTWTASATYYAAAVDVLRNGTAWAGADVELWQGGVHVQTLGYDTTETKYLAPYVQKRGADEPYDVRVLSGSISGADTEEAITGAVTTAAVAYYDVAYRNRGADYLIQIVRAGQLAARPADPYQVGVTFRDWLTEGGTPYDFGGPVTDAVTLHADFDSPTLNIGGYVKCDDDGDENGGTGGYYRMANLSIRGFPLAGKPMSAAKLYVTNGAVTFLSEDGYKISNEIDETTGNGIVSILFTGDPDGPGEKVSADTAQQFLREKVIVEVKDKAVRHRLRASVFGTTN